VAGAVCGNTPIRATGKTCVGKECNGFPAAFLQECSKVVLSVSLGDAMYDVAAV
jgi:hypothetical protein